MVVVKDTKSKDKEDPVEGVGYITAKECKEIDLVKDTYTTQIDMDRSPTLQRILKDISYLFCNSLCTAFIGGIGASVSQNMTWIHE